MGMDASRTNRAVSALLAALVALPLAQPASACTRTLYTGADGTVITGRSMDWSEDLVSNLWIFPAGMARHGAAGEASLRWTSKYGSVVVSGYEAGSADGLNEKGLAANVLYISPSRATPRVRPTDPASPSSPGGSTSSTASRRWPRRWRR